MNKGIRNEKTVTWYAMYRGDTFVDLGTADYLAEKYHKRKESWFIYLDRLLIEEQKKVEKDSYCIELKRTKNE